MSRAYKFHDAEGLYFISFAVVDWIDVFTRREYKDIVVDSLRYCQQHKGLELYAWCIMTNHVHLIASAKEGVLLQDIIRDLKKHTAKRLIQEITDSPIESRKDWMLGRFAYAAKHNSNNKYYQFWRQDNRPIQLFTPEVTQQKLDYLHDNPVVAGFVGRADEYLYSSAIDYTDGKGLLPVSFLY